MTSYGSASCEANGRVSALNKRLVAFASLTRTYRPAAGTPAQPLRYVCSSPSLFYGGYLGEDMAMVLRERVQIVEETIALYQAEGRDLLPSTSGRNLANTLEDVA